MVWEVREDLGVRWAGPKKEREESKRRESAGPQIGGHRKPEKKKGAEKVKGAHGLGLAWT